MKNRFTDQTEISNSDFADYENSRNKEYTRKPFYENSKKDFSKFGIYLAVIAAFVLSYYLFSKYYFTPIINLPK